MNKIKGLFVALVLTMVFAVSGTATAGQVDIYLAPVIQNTATWDGSTFSGDLQVIASSGVDTLPNSGVFVSTGTFSFEPGNTFTISGGNINNVTPFTLSGNYEVKNVDSVLGIETLINSFSTTGLDTFYGLSQITSGSLHTFNLQLAGGGNMVTSGHMTMPTTPVPIPAAAGLFGSGLVGLFGVRRRLNA